MSRSVSTLWIGGTLSWVEELCLKSFVTAGLRVLLYTYDSQMTAPSGVEICQASEILPREMVFENANRPGTYAAFSNIFRYRLLQKKDTIWVDSDVLAGENPLPEDAYLFGRESRKFINGAILKAPRDSDFLQIMLQHALDTDPGTIQWGQLGPKLVTSTAARLDISHLAQNARTFYPVNYRQVWRLFDPSQLDWCSQKVKHASTIHMWNEVLRGRGIKEVRPPEGSFLSNIAEKVGYRFSTHVTLSVSWVRNEWRPDIDPRPFENGFLDQRAGRAMRLWRNLTKPNPT